ncbi:MAG TPA: glycosyltransferase family 1 protein [Ohtaekwangia sp.]|uniref:glycosyltransferase family 4 protein n=1 Tax=Ohtaekwangia sp. TaxID=2066019 RepID=UPI002F948152
MRIGFEAKRLFTNFTGLGNYSRFVVNALSEFIPENQYILYSPKIRSHPEIDPIVARTNVTTVGPTGGYRFFKSLWRSWGVSHHETIKDVHIFHGLSQELPAGLPSRIRKVVTVHDLIYIRYPQFYNPIDVAIYTAKAKAACRAADRVIAISQQTADDLVNFLKVDPNKISIVYQGCHPSFKRKAAEAEKQSVKTKYSLPDQFILNVGTIEERKNVKLLVEALAHLPESNRLPVVIVGRSTDYIKQVQESAARNGVAQYIRYIHNVSFQDLPTLYQLSTVFVYPSLFEGFGIPLVEAIESGIPVITSEGSCFHEAAGPDALYTNPSDGQQLASLLEKVISDKTVREGIIQGSQKYIARFEPPVIAQALNEVYRAL